MCLLVEIVGYRGGIVLIEGLLRRWGDSTWRGGRDDLDDSRDTFWVMITIALKKLMMNVAKGRAVEVLYKHPRLFLLSFSSSPFS
jgi:hypothetical protein